MTLYPVNRDELHKLYEISSAVNSSLNLKTVLQFIMKVTHEIFKAEASSIMLLNEKRLLTIEAAQGLDESIIASTAVPPGEGIAGWVAQHGEPVLLQGKVTDPKFKHLIDRKENIKSSICVPLKISRRTIGVLMLRNPTSAAKFTEEHLRFLSAIADQAATAVENARLYRQEQERVHEMIRLNQTISYEKMKVDAIISSMGDALVVTDLIGKVLVTNPAALRVLKHAKIPLVGQDYWHLFRGMELEGLHQKAKEGKMSSTEILLKEPTEIYLHVIATPMRDAGGNVQGVVFLLQDITELKRIVQMKSNIVSMVTHDLKAPLTSIDGFIDILLSGKLPPGESAEHYLTVIKDETERMIRLIANLLELAKLETGEFKIKPHLFDLTRVIKAVSGSLSYDHKKHSIRLNLPDAPIKIFADEDLIVQVLHNLLSNAIKYSPNGGAIEIHLRANGQSVEVDISDSGIGIPEETFPRLFDRFYRVRSKGSKDIPGTGLGLANVKYIVQAHGGTLRVVSEEGKGSTFSFSLPALSPLEGSS